MSHVNETSLVMKRLVDIEAAAKRLGGTLHRDQHTYRMFSSGFVDDSTDWRNMFDPVEAERISRLSRQERIKIINKAMSYADHVISFPHASYDVGVIKKADGTFRLRWDYYGAGGLPRYMGDKDASLFTQAYTVEAAKRAARLKGYMTKETTRSDGQIELDIVAR